MNRHDSPRAKSDEGSAVLAGIFAFLTWGIIPGYWKLMREVPAAEILAHRYLWTFVFLAGLLMWQRRWGEVQANARSPRALGFCVLSGCSISINWFVFIWAVNIGRIIETSLGYFMTPLVNVLFGALFLGERLTRVQFGSVLLALLGVLNLTFGYGQFPWVAVLLCVSFGIYGLFRKQSGTAAIPGLFFETLLLTPIAIGYLLLLRIHGQLIFGADRPDLTMLLLTTGIVTAVPLVWFGHAARHLRLTTLGFLQYLSPTCSFVLGVFVYHEPFSRTHLITFSLIWLALIVFTVEAITRLRADRRREVLSEAICDGPV
jgi:chloramphenicol-sensitive protein RarD